jgi:hypothetical protein
MHFMGCCILILGNFVAPNVLHIISFASDVVLLISLWSSAFKGVSPFVVSSWAQGLNLNCIFYLGSPYPLADI